MTHRRLPSFSSACALLAAGALFALPVAPASAASQKVLLVTRGEEGEGPPAVQGEAAHITQYLKWPVLDDGCGGVDEGATVGKNPSGTGKVAGSDTSIGAQCFSETSLTEPTGEVTIKSASVAKTGAVKLIGDFEISGEGCTYRATTLTGTQVFGAEQEWTETLTGTGKRISPSLKACAKTTSVEDFIGVANAAGYNYVVRLTGEGSSTPSRG
jgi:hypothetical protein